MPLSNSGFEIFKNAIHFSQSRNNNVLYCFRLENGGFQTNDVIGAEILIHLSFSYLHRFLSCVDLFLQWKGKILTRVEAVPLTIEKSKLYILRKSLDNPETLVGREVLRFCVKSKFLWFEIILDYIF